MDRLPVAVRTGWRAVPADGRGGLGGGEGARRDEDVGLGAGCAPGFRGGLDPGLGAKEAGRARQAQFAGEGRPEKAEVRAVRRNR